MRLERYARQIAFDNFSEADQKKISKSTVAVVGLGALGSWSSELLARAGVGKLILIDRDVVDLTNLQRQNYAEKDIGRAKSEALKERLSLVNKEVSLIAYASHLDAMNADKILAEADLIVDGTDNFDTRYLLNDFAKKKKIPWVYAGAIGSTGTVFPIMPGHACFQCLFGRRMLIGKADTCETAGIINATNTTSASLQVSTALKLLTGKKVESKATYFDVWSQTFSVLSVKKRKECESCRGRFLFLEKKPQQTISLCGKHAYHIRPMDAAKIDLRTLELRLKGSTLHGSSVLKYKEMTLFADGRAIMETANERKAKSLYSHYVGN